MKTPFELWSETAGLANDREAALCLTAFNVGLATLAKTLGLDVSHCGTCGLPVWWGTHHTKGTRIIVSRRDGCGCSHFADCPQADQHRKVNA